MFSLYAMQQYFIWNTFGPISTSVKKVYNWNNGDIALLANWDVILFIVFSLQQGWLIQKLGTKTLNPSSVLGGVVLPPLRHFF